MRMQYLKWTGWNDTEAYKTSLPTEHNMKNENFNEWDLCLEIAQLKVLTNCV